MRWNIRLLVLLITAVLLCVCIGFMVSCSARFSSISLMVGLPSDSSNEKDSEKIQLVIGDIPCIMNGKNRYLCLRDNHDEVYVPFNAFLAHYFDVSGQVVLSQDGEERFEWKHSYSTIKVPDKPYETEGVFAQFASYNVELRDRVKCVSGVKGVPLSIQWQAEPYFYPIQIAQFALQHYSRNLTEPKPKINHILTTNQFSSWVASVDYAHESTLTLFDEVQNDGSLSNSFRFFSPGTLDNTGIRYSFDESDLMVLQFKSRFLSSQSSFTVIFERMDTHALYAIHYLQNNFTLNVSEATSTIFYGIGQFRSEHSKSWRVLTRNIFIDACKGLAVLLNNRYLNLVREAIRLRSVSFRGEVIISELNVMSSAHMSEFFNAADWFIEHQDRNGGWSVSIDRTVPGTSLELKSGWYSAMAQGHGISVLARAYLLTKQSKYINAALQAVELFNHSAESGGILNLFLDRYPWYEEYPTVPGTFVLNGFLYSLFGLYDLRTIVAQSEPKAKLVARLYRQGLDSLRALLPLYDSGTGSLYDLRHVQLKMSPNLARWDYHSVHIYLLLLLYSIEPEPLFEQTANRWIAYANGERAKHN